MDKFHPLKTVAKPLLIALVIVLISGLWFVMAQSSPAGSSDKALIEGFRRVEVASVSDALEQLTGVRDVAYLRKIGFPVYATGIVPSTSVHHYRFSGSQVPLKCDGVTVAPGDIVAADSDGVVIIPRAKAVEVLNLAQQMDFKEHSMYPVIEKLKSIQEAVKQFGRL